LDNFVKDPNMTIILNNRQDINLENAHRIINEKPRVLFSPAALSKMQQARLEFERLLSSDAQQFIYGTTTAPGARAKDNLSAAQQHGQGKKLHDFVSLAPVQIGNRYLPEHISRLIIFARLTNFIEGHGKVRPEIAQRVAELLNGPLPSVPLVGLVSPGEVIPLMHLYEGALTDLELAPGEAMGLINGSPCAAALVSETALSASQRMQLIEHILALSIEAFGAPLDGYDPALLKLWNDPFDQQAIQTLNRLLTGASSQGRRSYQPPVSWRIIPRLLGVLYRAEAATQEIAGHSLSSVSDNPVFLEPDPGQTLGRCISTGGFHNAQAARAIDNINATYADISVLCAKQTSKLLDGSGTGLPSLLIAPDSGIVGTEFLAWIQTDLVERARRAAQPALLSSGLDDPQGGQSDIPAPVFSSYEHNLTVTECLDHALVILGVVCSQALFLAGRQPAPPLQPFLDTLRDVVPPLTDRSSTKEFNEGIRTLSQMFGNMALQKDTNNFI